MPTIRVRSMAFQSSKLELDSSNRILTKTHESVEHLFNVFIALRTSSRGTTTDSEQDVLRAMIVFACAGLDSMVKQVIRDALNSIIVRQPTAQKQLENYTKKRMKKIGRGVIALEEQEGRFSNVLDTEFIAKALACDNPKNAIITELVCELTGNSMQSPDQLLMVASYFAIEKLEFIGDIDTLKEAINVRNEIIHEMDVNFNSPNRSRRQRNKTSMLAYTNLLLQTAESFLKAVDKRL